MLWIIKSSVFNSTIVWWLINLIFVHFHAGSWCLNSFQICILIRIILVQKIWVRISNVCMILKLIYCILSVHRQGLLFTRLLNKLILLLISIASRGSSQSCVWSGIFRSIIDINIRNSKWSFALMIGFVRTLLLQEMGFSCIGYLWVLILRSHISNWEYILSK